jgi:hypothetical protein
MTRAQRHRNSKPMIATGLGALALLTAQAGQAQSNAEATLADLEACAEIERDRARLACFDGVLASEPLSELPDAPVVAEESTTPTSRQDSGAAAAGETAAAATASAEVPAATTAAPAPRSVARSSPSSSSVASAAQSRPAPAVVATETREDQRASAAVAANTSSPDGENAAGEIVTIVNVNTQLAGSARFTTEDGKVYRQTSGGSLRGRVPDVPFEASIERGTLSSVFLSVGDNRRRVRVTLVD